MAGRIREFEGGDHHDATPRQEGQVFGAVDLGPDRHLVRNRDVAELLRTADYRHRPPGPGHRGEKRGPVATFVAPDRKYGTVVVGRQIESSGINAERHGDDAIDRHVEPLRQPGALIGAEHDDAIDVTVEAPIASERLRRRGLAQLREPARDDDQTARAPSSSKARKTAGE